MQAIFRATKAHIPHIKAPVSVEIPINARTVVFGPQKQSLLQAVAGKVLRNKGTDTGAISFPSFGKDLWPSQAIHYMTFNQSSSSEAPFVGARYESFRDEFDINLREYLKSKAPQNTTPEQIEEISKQLHLTNLLNNWYVGLSNGQSRRAQLAVALLRHPKLLVTDEPFLGLDPQSRQLFERILTQLPIPVVIGLRSGDSVPEWATQTLFADDAAVYSGPEAEKMASELPIDHLKTPERYANRDKWRSRQIPGNAIELNDINIAYKGAPKPLFDRFGWVVRNGERVHIRGPNGSGKSTLVALLTADHPQSWNNDVKLFGEQREVGKQSYFGINRDIGHSSPEIHAIFPKFMDTRKAMSTAFSGFLHTAKKMTPEEEKKVEEVCAKLGIDLNRPEKFNELPLDEQKLILFARAVAKEPKLLILDEAFSTLSGEQLKRVFDYLDEYDGTVLVIAHVDSEVPVCDSTLQL